MKIALSKEKLIGIVHSKTFIVAAAVVVVYTLAGFFLTPVLVRHYLPKAIRENLRAEATLGKVRFNPFLFKLKLHAFQMTDGEGEAIMAFERLLVDFELKSLFKWAWVFREIRIEAPAVQVVIDKEGDLNLARLRSTPAGGQGDAPGDKHLPRLIFEDIQVVKGKFIFTDRRSAQPATITLDPVDAAIGQLATLANREGTTTLTAVSANKEALKWSGQVSLNPLIVKGHLKVQDVRSATLTSFASQWLRLAPAAGSMTAESDCDIQLGGNASRIVFPNLSILLKDLALAPAEAPAAPFLKLPDAGMRDAQVDLTGHKLHVGSISIKGGSVRLAMNEKGVLNLERIVAPPQKSSPKAEPLAAGEKNKQAWGFDLGALQVDGFAAAYEDKSLVEGFKGAIGGIKLRLAAATDKGGALLVKDVLLDLAEIKAGFANVEPEVHIGSVVLENGNADLGRKQLKAAKIAVEGGAIQIERRRDGSLNLVQLFAPASEPAAATQPETADGQPATETAPNPAANPPPKPDNTPLPAGGQTTAFQFLVEKIAVAGVQATLWDHTVRDDQPILHLDNISAGAAQVDGRSPMPIELALSVREGGRLKAEGTLAPATGALTAKIDAASLALTALQPYVAQVATVEIRSGAFSTAGTLRHAVPDAGAGTVYQGGFKLENLQVVEKDVNETVLGWKNASTEQLKLLLQPNSVEIGDLRLQDLRGKAIIEKNSTFNLANLIKREPVGRTDASGPPSRSEPFAYRVRRVLVNDGRIKFADLRLRIPFATNIHELRGSVAGISSVAEARSELRLRGSVDEFGTARAEGELNTANPKRFTDIKLAFRNLEMTNLTPYSGQFAGRKIDGGKLSVDLAYQVDNGRLQGANQIVVDQLRLGEKVDSPEAVNLPLDLAVALLKDTNGVINLGLPVHGDLNNPQFSFGALVGKTLVNVLEKIVTSPFRALAALIPGGSENALDRVSFYPGRATVSPPEKEKLLNLAKALHQRPQLKLVVQGRYHPEKDRQALARQSLRRAVTVRLGQTVADDGPNPLDFSSSETRKVLEEMFTERFGKDDLKALAVELKAARKEAEATDPGFWAKELFSRLQAVETVPDEQLVALARARAQAVIAELSGPQGLPADRLGQADPVALKPSEEISVALSIEAQR